MEKSITFIPCYRTIQTHKEKIFSSISPFLFKVFPGISAHLSGVENESKFIVGDDAVSVIDEESKNHDVIFLGATTRPFLKNFLWGVFPEQVIRGTDKTVIMTRRWVKFRNMLKKKV